MDMWTVISTTGMVIARSRICEVAMDYFLSNPTSVLLCNGVEVM